MFDIVATHFPVDKDFSPWQQRRVFATPSTPSTITSSQGGISGIDSVALSTQLGITGVQNDIEEYLVYVNGGSLPDLTLPPLTTSPSLPISIPITPPVSGVESFYVLVRKQDHYGLVSQNQNFSVITIDSNANLLMPALRAPQNLKLFELAAQEIRVLAAYSGAGKDQFPATHWRIWYGLTLPDPMVDLPDLVVPVAGMILVATIPSQAPATYYVMVALYRSRDLSISPPVYSTVIIHLPPDQVIPVPSGFQVE